MSSQRLEKAPEERWPGFCAVVRSISEGGRTRWSSQMIGGREQIVSPQPPHPMAHLRWGYLWKGKAGEPRAQAVQPA